ncbi:hypothetical protein MNBD_ALPHA07-976 [hydrothermal vent metagenome]|uniref:DUF304 domain-containing protein n=1 Tax=hydrothermal vent metagenome TaxID=652676 RepID=A0A3B0T729_9ZZZZ
MDNAYSSMTPTTPLEAGESVLHAFHPSSAIYMRDHKRLAVAAMVAGMWILWLMGNPYVWTGAIGGLAAVAVRAFYLASDELGARWDLTETRLLGPQGRAVRLSEIGKLRTFGSAVQIVTKKGDKHLMKYQADNAATKASIEAAIREEQR